MRFIAGILLLALAVMFCPPVAAAADFQLNISVVHHADGVAIGELWWNNRLVCRLRLVGTEVPVVSPAGGSGTLVVPDIVGGMFVVKLAGAE